MRELNRQTSLSACFHILTRLVIVPRTFRENCIDGLNIDTVIPIHLELPGHASLRERRRARGVYNVSRFFILYGYSLPRRSASKLKFQFHSLGRLAPGVRGLHDTWSVCAEAVYPGRWVASGRIRRSRRLCDTLLRSLSWPRTRGCPSVEFQ